jgi:hypothetical protein
LLLKNYRFSPHFFATEATGQGRRDDPPNTPHRKHTMAKKPHKNRPQRPSDSLLQVVRASGKTLYRIAKDSGVSYPTLHSFVTGKRFFRLEAFNKLCIYLGLVLKPERKGT